YLFGFGLDPYSMLVPFLVFAIGVSHGVQMINGIYHQTMQGHNRLDAARFTFRLLYIPALCALVTDGVGFAILYVIRIGVLQDMAVGAGIRFPVLILAMLVGLPLMMSYAGVSKRAVERQRLAEDSGRHWLWHAISRLATRRASIVVLLVVAVAAVWGFDYRKNLQIGDLDRGAPELRPDSRYNLDNQFMVDNYDATSDLFVVMLETPKEGNSDYGVLAAAELLEWQLQNLPGVQSTESLVDEVKFLNAAYNEGNFKWFGLPRDPTALNSMVFGTAGQGLANEGGTLSLLYVYLNDHKATTLDRVVKTVEAFKTTNDSVKVQYQLAAGMAGIEAATNIEIAKAQNLMLILVYGVVTALVLLTFRSVRATICVMVPLALTSLLCEVLMPMLGIGVKVATLPVISVGVGIGVDYGVYIYSRLSSYLSQGMPIAEAYYNTLKTTGRAVAFTGITLALGVFTWSFSAIKFQADMGILLTFMFLWNMIGALCLLPALAYWLAPARMRDGGNDAAELKLATH
ncbi:MAG: MMPL family transporter, partial [Rubrivivax sp.]|nr:MMPL family transporter [Rubrivivax sp.]